LRMFQNAFWKISKIAVNNNQYRGALDSSNNITAQLICSHNFQNKKTRNVKRKGPHLEGPLQH
jgi:hypothetical protein